MVIFKYTWLSIFSLQSFLFLQSTTVQFVQSSQSDSIGIYPKPTETREVQSLDGVWNFRITSDNEDGFKSRWFEQSLELIDNNYERMPVPSSYNDITEKREIHDFGGWAWYDRKFFVPSSWKDGDIILRFGSVNYLASVYVNGQFAMNHTGGHLPFQSNVKHLLKLGTENHISVAVNNVLTHSTLPQGSMTHKSDTRKHANFTEMGTNFDFFNYAGIHRSVWLSLVPSIRITDLVVVTTTESDHTTGVVQFKVNTNAPNVSMYNIEVHLLDRTGKLVQKFTASSETKTTIKVTNANLWWPFTMSPANTKPGYLYTLAVKLLAKKNNQLIDTIYQKIGIRNVTLTKTALLINGKPVYLRGFGRHEDQNVRGRSLDPAMIQKDFNLMKWIGANSFRTSHYPYAEEIMDEADEQGFMVIDEGTAVGLNNFSNEMLAQHSIVMRELIERDKNRPSVLMWSIANEPVSTKVESQEYFHKIASVVKETDPSTRPITGAINTAYSTDHMGLSLDVLMINRYYGWYSDAGYPQVVQGEMVQSLENFHHRFNKLIMISEYGADTIAGMHMEPSFVFSEDYQVELLIEYHKSFDTLRAKGFFIGEHIWNFADFMTIQQITRVGGNKKGIFTRERQPKAAARLLRCRYWKLSGDVHSTYREGFSFCPESLY